MESNSAVGAEDAAAPPSTIVWSRLIGFGQIQLDLGKIKAKFGQK